MSKTIYVFEENGLKKGFLKYSVDGWENEDIIPYPSTMVEPLGDTSNFEIFCFDEDSRSWSVVDNPYQVFSHKYMSSLDVDNSEGVLSSFEDFTVNPKESPEDWIVGVKRGSDSVEILGVKCYSVWDDSSSSFKFVEPILEDVVSAKFEELNSEVGDILLFYGSDVSGEYLIYDTDVEDRQNLRDAIMMLEDSGGGSALVRCTDVNGVKSSRELTLSQMKELERQIQGYKMSKLDDCAYLKDYIRVLSDIEDVYNVSLGEIDLIRNGSYVPYTKRDSYSIPSWRSSLIRDPEIVKSFRNFLIYR